MKKIAIVLSALFMSAAFAADAAVKNGDKIAFLGDSITQFGNRAAGGYVNLVISGLQANGISAVKVPAGISGHKSNQMLERLERDVISKKPQIMTLSCGVNDVWHGKRGIPLPEYKKNITAIVDKAQSAGIRVYILTATMITEKPEISWNTKLAGYNEFLRQLAKEKGCILVDLSKDMHRGIASFKAKYPGFKGNLYTTDGVHMNPFGNEMMAMGILRGFGLSEAQIAKARALWSKQRSEIGRIEFSAQTTAKLAVLAAEKGMSIQEYLTFTAESLTAK